MNETPAIHLSGLRKTFGALTAVDGVDLSIRPGEVVALLGPNGAGKSTTIDLALGLARPTAGRAELFGAPPRQAVAAGRVGAMLQGGALLPTLTVAESVALVAAAHRHPLSVAEALERARCTEIARQRVSKLSGGQLQRARFAVAVVSDPDLLFLDEPTAAMDVEARRTFWQSMREFTDAGRTVVFATHYLDEADEYADRIVMMARGRIVADGTPAEVKAVVSGRRIRATAAFPETGAGTAALNALPGVRSAERRGDVLTLVSDDSDATLRALLATHHDIHDIEVTAHTMDEAFLALTEARDTEGAHS
ncbi:ABC-2 type transport system ATP-binding protein [Leifsonia sp. 98AMF]|uniref:ABC transporter ATP-binding protein n=1 Tax=unclassified Leifsonia TaxID=2663824 RepID=UPI00087A8337|nr:MULTISPECIES: ABC transporter ATP-binding protein [unclassified Leifsonia]SDH67255.1 ABC-2 type transport system ATP-binding protein [Leifsonia sp. 197AMF]SDI72384.1 ABC-2 type transport system ATP-binding protein [Leifsonia sp. 466MF]SDK16802.1 ABC-2 type transport system ATP-binding protein [Leifsonia sp. 157MF]SDN75252.1 ABC-2 type transport system ATP-binding protein [Leifsonia sp. 509MF]SEN32951.1 ABC-2 type transport system ATP-binding protein [Leifsonia sp. 467MF]